MTSTSFSSSSNAAIWEQTWLMAPLVETLLSDLLDRFDGFTVPIQCQSFFWLQWDHSVIPRRYLLFSVTYRFQQWPNVFLTNLNWSLFCPATSKVAFECSTMYLWTLSLPFSSSPPTLTRIIQHLGKCACCCQEINEKIDAAPPYGATARRWLA